ncbi:MAG: hypothetical protein HKP48_04980 [Winogradskyella sp.]|uniref:nucleoside-triphosphatase n=1 Tax=Winogradskyella sp. TaxID=1883156 RepID=UPI0017B1B54A|nr:nucleoside-triphosphatase [Winogradskyella sp.]MBT8244591.1 hypothetical protein [Winogradskyella sp.]NNK22653.1 hypothetical protein [Winogradskyella sp.]
MIYTLTGEIEIGKSSALLKWANKRTDVFGVISPTNEDNKRYFLDINTRESFKMLATEIDDEIITVGRYRFLKAAFKRVNAIIEKEVTSNDSGFILIDELGKLELRSGGLHKSAELAINKTKHNKGQHLILVVRSELLDAILKKYKIVDSECISANQLLEQYIDNVTKVTKEDYQKL